MQSTTTYKKWDIVLVRFPFTNLKSTKKRPGLIVSPNEYNRGTDVVIAFMTSKIDRTPRPEDYLIEDWQGANLPKPTMIRMKFATIDKMIINKKLGRLKENDVTKFKKQLVSFFDSE